MNFFNIIRKGTDKRLSDLKGSAIYEIATEKLEPKPYAQLAKPLYLVSQWFSVGYHFISYVIALLGIVLFSFQLDSMIYQIILVLLSFILLAVIEIAKTNASNTIFSSIARKDNLNGLFLSILILTTLFSFGTSVWSANNAVYYASTNTKFNSIDSLQNNQIDSINSLYSIQISSLESSILASQNTLKTTSVNWKVNTAQTNLKESQKELTKLLESKQNSILQIKSEKDNQISKTDKNGSQTAKIAAVIFALFEVLNLVSYWFLYHYYTNVVLEKNLFLDNITKRITTAVHDATDTLTSTVSNLAHTAAVNTTIVPNTVTAVSKPQTIGFKIPSQIVSQTSQTTAVSSVPNVPNSVHSVPNSVPNEQKTVLSNGNRLCTHCNKPYIYKQSKQKFCSSECRITKWKQTTGKTFIKGKKGGKTV